RDDVFRADVPAVQDGRDVVRPDELESAPGEACVTVCIADDGNAHRRLRRGMQLDRIVRSCYDIIVHAVGAFNAPWAGELVSSPASLFRGFASLRCRPRLAMSCGLQSAQNCDSQNAWADEAHATRSRQRYLVRVPVVGALRAGRAIGSASASASAIGRAPARA